MELKEPYKSVKAIGIKQPNYKQNIVLSNGAVVPSGEVHAAYDQDEEAIPRNRGKAPRKHLKNKGFGEMPVGDVGNIVKDIENPHPNLEYNEYVVYDAS